MISEIRPRSMSAPNPVSPSGEGTVLSGSSNSGSSNKLRSQSLGGIPRSPDRATFVEASGFWTNLKNKVIQISTDQPKTDFCVAARTGVGAAGRWKDWGGLGENIRGLQIWKTNNFVQKMWSPEYFVTCKADAAEGIDTLGRSAIHLGAALLRVSDILTLCFFSKNTFSDSSELLAKNLILFLEDIGNLLLIGGKLVVNVEILNFVKGAIGAVFSTLALILHSGAVTMSIVPAFFALIGKCCADEGSNSYQTLEDITDFFTSNLKNVGKDLLSILASVGHAIPSWLPFVLTFVVPPVGAGLFVLKLAAKGTKYLGITDVIAYGGTFALLKMDKEEAKNAFEDQDALQAAVNISDKKEREAAINALEGASEVSVDKVNDAKKTIKEFIDAKHELDPRKSKEGMLLTAYAIHMVYELVMTLIEAFTPVQVSGFIPTAASWGGAVAIAGGVRAYGMYSEPDGKEKNIIAQERE